MTKNRLYRLLSRIVEIKRGEEAISLLLFCYFFLITAPYGIIKSVRDTKYLLEENDKDGDGKLSIEEFPENKRDYFNTIDTDL